MSQQRADAAIRRLVARVADAGGPAEKLRRVLEDLRGSPTFPVNPGTLDRMDAAAASPDLAEALRGSIDRALPRVAVQAEAYAVGLWLGTVTPIQGDVDAILAAAEPAATDLARALWLRCRRIGADSVKPLEQLYGHPAPHVGFFASCAARHLARSFRLPPLVPPTPGSLPDLGAPEAEDSTRMVTCAWAPTRSDAPGGPSLVCRVCASDATTTTSYRNGSGTGWRDETIEARCNECRAYTLVEITD